MIARSRLHGRPYPLAARLRTRPGRNQAPAASLAPLLLAAMSFGLAACGGGSGRTVDVSGDSTALSAPRNHLLGEDRSATGGDEAQAGVNAYLWRGAIDTLSFMPFASADPVGGIIITDWYTPPTTSGERFKATCYILGKQLRSDAIRVALFRQTQQDGQWVDAGVAPNTAPDITNKILARARQLRADSGQTGS